MSNTQRQANWVIYFPMCDRFMEHPRGGTTNVEQAYGYHYKKDALEEAKGWYTDVSITPAMKPRVMRRSDARKAVQVCIDHG